ncbi:MAG TPA: hypothetical protein VD926_07820, partial [Acidimicrobiales bacterium]|nr:hypothetical protein [Acidimicrobiales bacterium]
MGRGRLAVGVLALLAVACGSDDTGATLASTTTSPPSSANADDVTVEPGVEYARAEVADGRAPLLLDLYHPPGEADGPRPVAIVIHGGGFTSQSRLDDGIVQIAHALAEHGVVAASIDHRLDPQGPVPPDRVAGLLAALGGIDIAPAMAAAVDDTLT